MLTAVESSTVAYDRQNRIYDPLECACGIGRAAAERFARIAFFDNGRIERYAAEIPLVH
jgi:hypothetical protein